MSAAARQALSISALGPLDPVRYAEHVGVHILTFDELSLSAEARRQLLEVDTPAGRG